MTSEDKSDTNSDVKLNIFNSLNDLKSNISLTNIEYNNILTKIKEYNEIKLFNKNNIFTSKIEKLQEINETIKPCLILLSFIFIINIIVLIFKIIKIY